MIYVLIFRKLYKPFSLRYSWNFGIHNTPIPEWTQMYNNYVNMGKDWNTIARAVAIKLQTAYDSMESGNVIQINLTMSQHNKYYDNTTDITNQQTLVDTGSEFGTAGCLVSVNYDRVEVRALDNIGEGSIAISWSKKGVIFPVAETVLYINNESSRYNHNAVLEDVEVVDEDGEEWPLDAWYSSYLDAQQEQDITESEQEDLEN